MRYLLLLLAAVAFGADLPPDAANAVAAYDKACKEAQAKADDAKSAAASKLLPLLEAAQKKATQKGELDVALVIKEKREEVIAAALDTLAPTQAAGLEGGWWWGSLECHFMVDGTITGRKGTWKLSGKNIIMEVAGRSYTAARTGKNEIIGTRDDDGFKVRLIRSVKKP